MDDSLQNLFWGFSRVENRYFVQLKNLCSRSAKLFFSRSTVLKSVVNLIPQVVQIEKFPLVAVCYQRQATMQISNNKVSVELFGYAMEKVFGNIV